jgi:hypothetical protein
VAATLYETITVNSARRRRAYIWIKTAASDEHLPNTSFLGIKPRCHDPWIESRKHKVDIITSHSNLEVYKLSIDGGDMACMNRESPETGRQLGAT